MVPTAMTGVARRRSRGRRSIAAVAPTIMRIATPTLPMMSNVVPLCGPAVKSDDAWDSSDPLSRGIDPELLDDGPSSAVLLNASLPASSKDMPYAATVRPAPSAARRHWTAAWDRSRRASAIPAITNAIHVIVG